jgi:F-box/TPR repeat protein Pof3
MQAAGLKQKRKSIRLSLDRLFVLYDTRASVYEAISCSNNALRDAQKTIELDSTQWHGYFRSARLLASQGQRDAALRMCAMALGNLGSDPEDDSRRRELTELRQRLETVPTPPPPPCLISSLPVELLVTIFTLSNNPAVIAHVCHEWRAFAHSQPALWRNLVLTAACSGGAHVLRKIDEWHRWSSGWIAELHIHKSLGKALFPSGVGRAPDHSGLYNDVVAALRRLDLTKLKECHTQDMDPGLFLPALGGHDDGLHNLECLSSLSKCSRFMDYPFGCSTLSWQSMRSLNLAGVRCEWAELSMSMHCLTSFEYKIHRDHGCFTNFHQFLHANANTLEKLVVIADVPVSGTSCLSDTPPKPLTLAHLRHLELNSVLPFHISHGNFTLPSIRILRIPWLKEVALLLSILLDDGGTSFVELIEFTTPGGFVGPQILSAALVRAPKLKILRLSGFDCVAVAESLSKPLCTALLRDPSTQIVVPVQLPVLCPALSVLDLTWSSQLKAEQVVRIIKERIALAASEEAGRYQLPGLDGDDQRVSCIQTLTVDGCFQNEEDKFPWFQENVPEFSCRRT